MPIFPGNLIRRCLVLFLGGLLLLSLGGCVPIVVRVLPKSQGVVLDAETNQPIRGATITARYCHTGIAGTAVAHCDNAGRFTLGPRYALKFMVLGPNDANLGDRCQYTAEAPGYVGVEYLSGLVRVAQPEPMVSFDQAVGAIFRLNRMPPASRSPPLPGEN